MFANSRTNFSLILIDIAQRERVVKMGTFGVKRASDEYFCPSTVRVWESAIVVLVGPACFRLEQTHE